MTAEALREGELAPDFELADDQGNKVRLSGQRGQPVVLFFYPADDTPGCTKQACGYRDAWAEFQKAGARVFGISPDDVASHEKFRSKFSFPYPLLADVGHEVAERYGLWGEKNLYGNKFMGVTRSSVLIDAEGRVAGVFRNVRAEGNAERMLEELRKLVM